MDMTHFARYYSRKTGKRVSKDTWKRSHAQGSTRYVRRIYRKEKQKKESIPKTFDKKESIPKTFDEWEGLYEQLGAEDYEDEIETGIDY